MAEPLGLGRIMGEAFRSQGHGKGGVEQRRVPEMGAVGVLPVKAKGSQCPPRSWQPGWKRIENQFPSNSQTPCGL